ncbi:MAG: Holliday junction branch migration protein RuvA [Armatimonadetes bacterium]|nr:Holliday junction branch migration protein RuvA [Armatimonadota bacterium]
MIAHVIGELSVVEADHVVIDVGGIGYKVYAPLSVIAELPKPGAKLKLFTYTHVKEDAITLYGFADTEQQNTFELLLTVTGVGPKVALNILSVLPVESIVEAISRDDYLSLNRVPGVGNKMAQRIVLELKEKMATLAWVERAKKAAAPAEHAVVQDVVEGLVALGYDRQAARRAAEQAISSATDKKDTSEVLRLALKRLTQ